MSTGPLPDKIDHRKFGSDQVELNGMISLARFTRLCGLIENEDGLIHCKLRFKSGRKGKTQVTGQAELSALLICQSCLEVFEFTLAAAIRVCIVPSESAFLDLPPEDDGLVVPDRLVDIVDLVEDELIVALPMVPRHVLEQCEASFKESAPESSTGVDSQKVTETYRPFADLQALQDAE